MEFPFFLVKRAPVSELESVMDYTARFDASAHGAEIDFVLTVKVGVTTLCPCSKAISKHGAHNQRGLVTVQVRWRGNRVIWIEDLIALVESCASSPKQRWTNLRLASAWWARISTMVPASRRGS